MKAMIIDGGFGLERLRLVERPSPEPGPHEVVVRMRAVSLNYRDLLVVTGRYAPRQPLPLVPASDGAGEVLRVGAGVTRVRVGERVTSLFATGFLAGEVTRDKLSTTLGSPRDGVLAEEVLLPADAVVPAPEHLSLEEASTLPCAALTAWSALEQCGVRSGDTVLVEGTGGVAIATLQLAKARGATVLVTSKSDEKLARARALGADHVLHYGREPAWGKAARALTGGRGFDFVLEVGGAGTLGEALRAVRPGGSVAIIGVLSGTTAELGLLPVLMQNVRLQGVFVGHREAFEQMNRALVASRVHPVVDRTFALEETAEALSHLEAGKHFGKLVIRL